MENEVTLELIEELNIETYSDIFNDENYIEYKDVQMFLEENILFELRTIGYAHGITFLDIPIWHSDNDEREYNDEIDEYEPLKPYLIKKAKEILNILTKLNNFINKIQGV